MGRLGEEVCLLNLTLWLFWIPKHTGIDMLLVLEYVLFLKAVVCLSEFNLNSRGGGGGLGKVRLRVKLFRYSE